MINPMNVYIMQLAEKVRNYCENIGIIQKDQCYLDETTVGQIVACFGGKLQHITDTSNLASDDAINRGNSCLKETSGGFIIEYKDYWPLDILHELGHQLLEGDTMIPGSIREINDVDGSENEISASKFARNLIMPSPLFEKIVVENTHNGVCNIEAVANVFHVDYLQVVSHGRESYLWN